MSNCEVLSSVCLCTAESGDADNLAIGTMEEEVPVDTEFSEYIDVEGRTTDYMSVANEAELLSDGLHGTDLLSITAASITK